MIEKLMYNKEHKRYEGVASDGQLLIVSPEIYQEYHRTVGHTNPVELGEQIAQVSWWEGLLGQVHWSDVRKESSVETAEKELVEEAQRAALAKYRVRAARPHSKNHEAEDAAISQEF